MRKKTQSSVSFLMVAHNATVSFVFISSSHFLTVFGWCAFLTTDQAARVKIVVNRKNQNASTFGLTLVAGPREKSKIACMLILFFIPISLFVIAVYLLLKPINDPVNPTEDSS